MNLHACIAQNNGSFRTVVDNHALAHCAPDTYILELARSSCDLLACSNAAGKTQALFPFEIEAHTLGGKKTKSAALELYSRFRTEIEDQWGVDTADWNGDVGVLQCRSAAYHHDPFNSEVAYINWYVEGPAATFELNGKRIGLEPGHIVVFDPYCPHALYYTQNYEFVAEFGHHHETMASSLFVTLEVPLKDVAYLLGTISLQGPGTMERLDAPGSVDPSNGQWKPSIFSDPDDFTLNV